jgi:hypothetical protein
MSGNLRIGSHSARSIFRSLFSGPEKSTIISTLVLATILCFSTGTAWAGDPGQNNAAQGPRTGQHIVDPALNQPPVAACLGHFTARICNYGDQVCVPGFACTDPDGNLATCEVSLGVLDNGTVCFTAPTAGDYAIRLIATDGAGLADTCETIVTVTKNSPPSCQFNADKWLYFVCSDSTFNIPVGATDVDNNLVGCSKISGVGTFINGIWSFTTTGAGVYRATFVCTDSCGATCQTEAAITVNYNRPPVAVCPGDTTLFLCGPGETCLDGFACTDPDNNVFECRVSTGTLNNWNGTTLCFTPQEGMNVITLIVKDGCGLTDTCISHVNVVFNRPPTMQLPPNANEFLCAARELCFPITMNDPDYPQYQSAPKAYLLRGHGHIQGNTLCFTPDPGIDTTYWFVIQVCDSCGTPSNPNPPSPPNSCVVDSFSVTVKFNHPPVVTCPGDKTVDFVCGPSQVCTGLFSATDPENNIATQTVSLGTFANGTVCFMPDTAGVYTITYIVTDSCGASAQCQTHVTVHYTDRKPVATCPGNMSLTLCDLQQICIDGFSCSDPDGNLASCTAIGGVLNGSTVCLTPVVGPNVIKLIAADVCGKADTCEAIVTVSLYPPPALTDKTVRTALCAPGPVCVALPAVVGGKSPFTWTYNGRTVSDTVCFYLHGDTTITGAVVVTDSCGKTSQSNLTLIAHVNSAPVISITASQNQFLCAPGRVCVKIGIVDPDNGLSGISQIGTFNKADSTVCFTADTSGHYCDRIIIRDSCGLADTAQYCVDVTINRPPAAMCPGDTTIYLKVLGQICLPGFVCSDPDGNQASCRIEGVNGQLNGGTVCFTPQFGLNTIYLIVTDGCGRADTCTAVVTVNQQVECPVVTIQKTHGTLQGHYENVAISYKNGSFDIGGFDLLIAFDASALTFTEALAGSLLDQCHWEHFSYRFGPNGNCGNGCPSGLIRLVGLAETNNGPYHPSCYRAPDDLPWDLAVLRFLVSNDRNFNCMYVPITFYWLDCADNAFSTVRGDSLILDSRIFDFEGNLIWNEGDNVNYPESGRLPNTGAPDNCLTGAKVMPLRCLDLQDGGVDIVCADSIDARGDINANGVANEVADAVMLTNYFISGLIAFQNHTEASIAASDINSDGTVLSVADLVYLIRIIVGDATPYAKITSSNSVNVTTQATDGQLAVRYDTPADIGAVFMTFDIDGTAGVPLLGDGATGMDMSYGQNGRQLRLLIYNIGKQAIRSGDHELVSILASGAAHLTSVEAADYSGHPMEIAARNLPQAFELSQNYPNPFNPSTVISLSLPAASSWNIYIYNVAGQIIRSYDGNSPAGTVQVTWDGTDNSGVKVSSGIYFYKAVADNFTATKKMILMK